MIGPRLKDLGRWFSGGTPPSERAEYWDGDVPWLSGKDFDKTVLREPTKFTTAEGAALHSRLVPGGQTVLILVRGMALAHGLPVARLPFDAAINQDVRGLVLRAEFDPAFVYYALVGSRAVLDAHIDRAAHGTARLMETVYSYRIAWMPELAVQRTIATFLDRENERIRSAIRVAADALTCLDGSERSIADAVVHGLPRLPLKAVATIHSGVTLNEAKAPAHAVRVPYLRVANVKAGWLELEEIKEVPISPGDIPHYALKPGDLLLTEGGDLDKLGRGALWAGDISPCLFQNHVFAVRPRHDAAVPAFLSWATRSSAARSYFEATASRITNIASTNRSKLGRWPVPDAPIEEQRRRVAVAESAWQRAQRAITTARDLSNALTAYRDSLIHEAVTGKLDVTAASDRQMDERLHAAAEGRLDEVPV